MAAVAVVAKVEFVAVRIYCTCTRRNRYAARHTLAKIIAKHGTREHDMF